MLGAELGQLRDQQVKIEFRGIPGDHQFQAQSWPGTACLSHPALPPTRPPPPAEGPCQDMALGSLPELADCVSEQSIGRGRHEGEVAGEATGEG